MLHQPRYAITAVLVILDIAGAAGWFGWRTSRARWARNEVLPAASRSIQQLHVHGAWRLLREAERYIPDDPQLRQMREVITAVTSIRTVPDGADIFIKDYSDPDDAWEMIGRSPLDQVRIPQGYLRWKFVKPGYEPLEAAKSSDLTPRCASNQKSRFRLEW
jgi:hypothetical protein